MHPITFLLILVLNLKHNCKESVQLQEIPENNFTISTEQEYFFSQTVNDCRPVYKHELNNTFTSNQNLKVFQNYRNCVNYKNESNF